VKRYRFIFSFCCSLSRLSFIARKAPPVSCYRRSLTAHPPRRGEEQRDLTKLSFAPSLSNRELSMLRPSTSARSSALKGSFLLSCGPPRPRAVARSASASASSASSSSATIATSPDEAARGKSSAEGGVKAAAAKSRRAATTPTKPAMRAAARSLVGERREDRRKKGKTPSS